MPTVNPSSFRYGNPAVAVALRPRFSFAQARQDRQMAYEIELRRNQLLKDRVLEKNQKEAAVAQSFEAISQLGLLTPDNARAMTFNQSALEDLQSKIKNEYGGDALRFLQVEGDQWNNNFKVNFANSPTLQRAILNKSNKGLADADANKEYRLVSWAAKTPDGQEVRKTGRYEENLGDFLTGATTELNYSGGFDFDLAEIKKFANTHADPTGTGQPYMSPEDVKAWALQNKISQDDANLWIERHYEQTKEGLQWDNYAVKVEQARQQAVADKMAFERTKEAGRNARQSRALSARSASQQTEELNLFALNPSEAQGVQQAIPTTSGGAFSWKALVSSDPFQVAARGALGITPYVTKKSVVVGAGTPNETTDSQSVTSYYWKPQPGMEVIMYDAPASTNGAVARVATIGDPNDKQQGLYYEKLPDGSEAIPVASANGVTKIAWATPQGEVPAAMIRTPNGQWYVVPLATYGAQTAAVQPKVVGNKYNAPNQFEINTEDNPADEIEF